MLLTLLATPQFTSRTEFFVSTRDSATTTEAFQGSQFSQERVASYAQLLTGDELARRVIDNLDLGETPSDLAGQITANVVPDTVLLEVTVTDPSAQRAQQIAEALGRQFSDLVTDLETPSGGGASLVKVTVVQKPEVPMEPSSPNPLRNAAIGAVLGLLIGTAAAISRMALDRSVRDPKEISGLVGSPVIGTVFRDERLATSHLIDRSSTTRSAEDYRQLRTNLQFLNVDAPPRVIMVSSPMPSEGKTTVAVNLALALAEAGREVVVVEADLRRPRVTRYFGMVGGVGLTNILAGTAGVSEVSQPYEDGAVTVVGAGPTPPNPSQLLASAHMSSLIAQLRDKYEYVLIDAPPLLPVADATGLAAMVDGVLLSVRYGSSRKDQLQRAAEALEQVGARVLGVILNIVPPKADVSGSYGYGYSYASDLDGGARRLRRQQK
ncbi:receptor protein-tyrosine kinase [Geodermatophilus daqingensis]|uniref:non-specific protein-tyrosine kinase n=1 Tax=Petropleomorpha daqingensis TaxID=2026353 RepID=A0A853CFD5_9ACTN|nr:receptor protein-tyrosine kinase [Petropleomorpha daqingensis]